MEKRLYKSNKNNENDWFDLEWLKNNSIYDELQGVSVFNT